MATEYRLVGYGYDNKAIILATAFDAGIVQRTDDQRLNSIKSRMATSRDLLNWPRDRLKIECRFVGEWEEIDEDAY